MASHSRWSTTTIAIAAFSMGVAAHDHILNLPNLIPNFNPLSSLQVPEQAQVFNQAKLAVIGDSDYNGVDVYVPPGKTLQQLIEKPFHVYDEEFLRILGPNPKLTIIAETDGNPLFHEAVVWYPPTDEAFFAQNAGPESAGTGLNKSAVVQKISLKDAEEVAAEIAANKDSKRQVKIDVVNSNPVALNPNGKSEIGHSIAADMGGG